MKLEDTFTSENFIEELSNKLFNKAHSQPKFLREQIEIEIRFGQILKNPRPRFHPSIKKDVFLHILNHYKKLKSYIKVTSLETNYIIKNTRFASINNKIFLNTKKKAFNFDKETFTGYLDFRVAFANEQKVLSKENESVLKQKSDMIRIKKRTSFTNSLKEFKVEFSEVVVFERNKNGVSNFEIEIEILNNKKFLELVNNDYKLKDEDEDENKIKVEDKRKELVKNVMKEVCKILTEIKLIN